MSAALIAQMRAKRTTWVDLGDGVAVAVLRPAELEMSRMVGAIARGEDLPDADLCAKHVTGWRGITETTLLGESLGSAAPVPFDPELWAEIVSDREEWARAVAAEVMRSVEAYITKRTAAMGKSSGSSTNPPTGSCSGTTDPSPASLSA